MFLSLVFCSYWGCETYSHLILFQFRMEHRFPNPLRSQPIQHHQRLIFQFGLRIRDEILMMRMSCLLASSNVQLIYTSASALLVKAENLWIWIYEHIFKSCTPHPALIRSLQAVSLPVAFGLYGFLEHIFLLTLLSRRCLLVPRFLVSLADVNLQILLVRKKAPGCCFISEGHNFNPYC